MAKRESKAAAKRKAAAEAAHASVLKAREDAEKAQQEADAQYLKDAAREMITDYPLGGLRFAGGQIPCFKAVDTNLCAFWNRSFRYTVGQVAYVPGALTNEQRDCGEGINVAPLDWVLRTYADGHNICARRIRVLRLLHSAADIAAIPFGSDGKYRVTKAYVDADITQELVDAGLLRGETTEQKTARELAAAVKAATAKGDSNTEAATPFDGIFRKGDIVRYIGGSHLGHSDYVLGAEYAVTRAEDPDRINTRALADGCTNGWLRKYFEFVRRPSTPASNPESTRAPGEFRPGDKVKLTDHSYGTERGLNGCERYEVAVYRERCPYGRRPMIELVGQFNPLSTSGGYRADKFTLVDIAVANDNSQVDFLKVNAVEFVRDCTAEAPPGSFARARAKAGSGRWNPEGRSGVGVCEIWGQLWRGADLRVVS